MDSANMVPVNEFCIYNNIELSFIYSLNESGLIDVSSIEETLFVPIDQLRQLEQLIRMKQEMDINVEGIETIAYLLQRINILQQQVVQLNNRLAVYEAE